MDNPELADELEEKIMQALKESSPTGVKRNDKPRTSDIKEEEADIEVDDEELDDLDAADLDLDGADDEFSIEENL